MSCGFSIQVEDFAERSQNCARAVREKEFDIIHQSFRDTLSHLDVFTGSSSQILEIQQTLFGVKSMKRTSEEPLVQPVEKHLKVSNYWTSMSNTAPYVGPDRVNGFAVGEPYGITRPHHSNHNRDLNYSRQQRAPFQGYQDYSGWARQGENIQAAGRGIISSIPGGQVPLFAEPSHDQMRPRIGSQPFPQQIHHSQMGYPAYNAQADVRPTTTLVETWVPGWVVLAWLVLCFTHLTLALSTFLNLLSTRRMVEGTMSLGKVQTGGTTSRPKEIIHPRVMFIAVTGSTWWSLRPSLYLNANIISVV